MYRFLKNMPISVFYSWQSQSPEKINHYFIRDALKEAMGVIKNDCGLDERPKVDHDTKGRPGFPDIVQTIFSKIEASFVFVADVSFTSKSDENRLSANPNVLIELGFALHALGDERIILVMNEHFGNPKDQMPFNLAARRWPITYSLNPDCDKETYKKVKKELTDKLSEALKSMNSSGVLFLSPITSSSLRSDRQLFNKLLEQCPPSGDIASFLKEYDVATPIHRKYLDAIENFINEWDNSLYEFINNVLEDKRKQFLDRLKLFFDELYKNIWESRENENILFMSMGSFDYNESKFLKKADELNNMGSEAYQAHQDLIRECKLKLGFSENT